MTPPRAPELAGRIEGLLADNRDGVPWGSPFTEAEWRTVLAALRGMDAYLVQQDEAADIARVLGTPTQEQMLEAIREAFPRAYEKGTELLARAAAYREAARA